MKEQYKVSKIFLKSNYSTLSKVFMYNLNEKYFYIKKLSTKNILTKKHIN
ncbi:MAG: hypothetical protein KZY61_07735 [Clostridiaceae bacterium]|nr:hypothetical protein [Clostridium sp. cpc1]MBV1820625.1 hypothetical protein [Bacteroidales bacterium MSK.15.36]MBW4827258.1 hypothetical protein [Clostridiaceae bacterium]MCG4584346.1 hypothetical protein [Anaerosalibacter bizertensis]MBW4859569.1 hypothetical protein [Clostridiaceae bacterium]MBW4868538.1 hypothetical protein [Clostridiaceae bacterium]